MSCRENLQQHQAPGIHFRGSADFADVLLRKCGMAVPHLEQVLIVAVSQGSQCDVTSAWAASTETDRRGQQCLRARAQQTVSTAPESSAGILLGTLKRIKKPSLRAVQHRQLWLHTRMS